MSPQERERAKMADHKREEKVKELEGEIKKEEAVKELPSYTHVHTSAGWMSQ